MKPRSARVVNRTREVIVEYRPTKLDRVCTMNFAIWRIDENHPWEIF